MTKFLDADAATPEGMKIIMKGFSKAMLIVMIPAAGFLWLAAATGLFAVDWITTRGDAIAFVGQNLTVAGLVFAAHIMWVSLTRATPTAEKWQEGGRPSAGSKLDLAQRVTLNTAEQAVLFAFAQLALASAMPLDQVFATRILALIWLVARIVYVAGYLRHPFYRSYGFNLSILPTILALGYAVWCMAFV
ncbi:MAPEG family protein [Loktanella sp. TSTF-M6]|uniref:MAPEG family protein n=1 Tax=Loktanella gaetbuli TaxID=2881335 RepID=A0ABS8BW22_9RHOB|nr:MAPEG family protein [Loktanella gaetbuli]MCB5199938.1 MAPEG family protein [Loktanella gaetbuli]